MKKRCSIMIFLGALAACTDKQFSGTLEPKICRRTRAVGSFPGGHAALMLVNAHLRYMAGQKLR